MLQSVSSKLREALEKITRLGVVDREAVEGLVKDIQRTLIGADVDVALVYDLSERIRKAAMVELPPALSRREHVVHVVYEELTTILGSEKATVSVSQKKILLVGLFGSGKTTTAAKLARFYQSKGLTVGLVCCDTVRPAAFEQLQQLAKSVDVQFFGIKGERNPVKVLERALAEVKRDVIIVDSSGRSALDKELMDEIRGINRLLEHHDSKSYEKILVIPADIGQAAKEQARAFGGIGITSVVVTKMDATAKGGGAITACYETGAKVVFLTVGEKPGDIEEYDPKRFVSQLLGFPDLEALLQKARTVVDEESAAKVITGDFTIEEFYQQLESVRSMGSFSKILDMMGAGKLAQKMPLDVQEEKIKRWKFAIQSMTRQERGNPDIINASRVRRIARGSGLTEHEVREMISNYTKVKKMMRKMSPSKLKRSGFFKQFGMKM